MDLLVEPFHTVFEPNAISEKVMLLRANSKEMKLTLDDVTVSSSVLLRITVVNVHIIVSSVLLKNEPLSISNQ